MNVIQEDIYKAANELLQDTIRNGNPPHWIRNWKEVGDFSIDNTLWTLIVEAKKIPDYYQVTVDPQLHEDELYRLALEILSFQSPYGPPRSMSKSILIFEAETKEKFELRFSLKEYQPRTAPK